METVNRPRERNDLLARLTTLDFVALDLALFLNINPGCAEALEKYNDTISEANEVRRLYEMFYGPLCSFRSEAGSAWQWSDNPWPWQESSNFDI
ncbi:MAG: spore coat protein CotJB [Defluviitaleaceae bacterium]|nr:spore coat protein CotJB [Defluviitaleaceae bacterium]